jgi:hypothetical protein
MGLCEYFCPVALRQARTNSLATSLFRYVSVVPLSTITLVSTNNRVSERSRSRPTLADFLDSDVPLSTIQRFQTRLDPNRGMMQGIVAFGRQTAIGSDVNVLDVDGKPANVDNVLGKDHLTRIQRRLVPTERHTPSRHASFARPELSTEAHGELVARDLLFVKQLFWQSRRMGRHAHDTVRQLRNEQAGQYLLTTKHEGDAILVELWIGRVQYVCTTTVELVLDLHGFPRTALRVGLTEPTRALDTSHPVLTFFAQELMVRITPRWVKIRIGVVIATTVATALLFGCWGEVKQMV